MIEEEVVVAELRMMNIRHGGQGSWLGWAGYQAAAAARGARAPYLAQDFDMRRIRHRIRSTFKNSGLQDYGL